MYPRLIVDINKLRSNLDAVAAITKDQGSCSLMIVTKGLCADHEMAKMVAEHPAVDYMADSRVANIKTCVARLQSMWLTRELRAMPLVDLPWVSQPR